METRFWRGLSQAMERFSRFCGYLTGGLIVVSAALITYEVIWRYYLSHPHTWSLEVNIFLLIGATFLASSFTQFKRGHVGTEVLDLVIPKHWIPWRVLVGDVLSCAVCVFIGISVSLYAVQAWNEGWTTDSTWAPPLWIPYTLMAVGMWMTALQSLVQIVEQLAQIRSNRQEGAQ
jgi:TRAP-type C4-dicarboxylate transport system permease small subunit